MDGEWPKMLYRKGTAIKWDGRDLDHHVVNSEDEELAALEEGWVTHTELPKLTEKRAKAT